jgi:hypothetical protein
MIAPLSCTETTGGQALLVTITLAGARHIAVALKASGSARILDPKDTVLALIDAERVADRTKRTRRVLDSLAAGWDASGLQASSPPSDLVDEDSPDLHNVHYGLLIEEFFQKVKDDEWSSLLFRDDAHALHQAAASTVVPSRRSRLTLSHADLVRRATLGVATTLARLARTADTTDKESALVATQDAVVALVGIQKRLS